MLYKWKEEENDVFEMKQKANEKRANREKGETRRRSWRENNRTILEQNNTTANVTIVTTSKHRKIYCLHVSMLTRWPCACG